MSRKPANRRERRHPELIGVPEAAARCGVHYRTFRRWIAEGRIKAVRVGPRLLKIDASDLPVLLAPTGGAAR
ncbi:excisionase family DNA-binding protein [Mycobacterium marinum]|uniref:excisionase family DNA-binding protein n=1 Tax=Mycobacterium marinum TaxID=1781 RepID=UPI002359DA7D|nr:excisionase family DNA-binding protein [Mycobacterium marinum]MDC9015121.1 excisionase family DNA-binding protein [Mycobacterium marinum]